MTLSSHGINVPGAGSTGSAAPGPEPDGADPFGTAALRGAVLDAWRASPTRFREDANAEEDLRLGGYRDRLLVELAQNAADAAAAAGVDGELSLSIVDTPAGVELRAANTGAPLDAEGVAALASLRASAKRAGGSVGRFGVGFAAVLAVTDAPRVVSTTGGVAFSGEWTTRLLAGQPELAAQVAGRAGAVPVLRLVWPVGVEEPPPPGHVTEVRLPLRADVDGDALLAEFAEDATDLLLALPGLRRIDVVGAKSAGGAEPSVQTWWREQTEDGTVVLHGPDDERRGGPTRWLVHRHSGVLTGAALHGLGVEARQRPEWTVCWAVRLNTSMAAVPLAEDVLHAPTPTDERLSLPARLLATLPVEPSRRRLLPGPAADAVLAAAARSYPELVAALPIEHRTAMVPLPGFPLSEVDDRIREGVLRELGAAPWLVSHDGTAVAPTKAKVLDVASEELAALLSDVLPDLLPARLAEPRHAPALAAVGVARLRLADVVAAVSGLNRPPEWWRRLYAALAPIVEADATAREELGGLPVPLADGRTVTGPRDVLLPDADADTIDLLSAVDTAGLRIAHPDAIHPMLERVGARRAGPEQMLDSPALRAAVERSVDDAESGMDTSGLADAVLRLVERADVLPGERPWLAAIALPDADGEPARADELVLPGSRLLDVLAEDAPLGVLADEVAQRWPAELLRAVGVLDSFAVLVDDTPTGPDHDLADEEDWWAALAGRVEPPARLEAVRDLDLVAADAWPAALRLLAEDEVTARPLWQRNGYTAWWLARHARLAGHPPRHWRLASARALAGLYDAVPDVGLSDHLLGAVGVRAVGVRGAAVGASVGHALHVDGQVDAEDLLLRLADRDRDVPPGTVLLAHAALADAVRAGRLDPSDVEPPDRVRSLAGTVVPADRVVVLDRPWLLAAVAADGVVAAMAGGDAEALAELLDLPLASERVRGTVAGAGRSVAWTDVEGVARVCGLARMEPPDAEVVLHDDLVVHIDGLAHVASWWVDDDGAPHAENAPDGLARALAWATDRWPDRHLLAALLTTPTPATLLG